MFCYNINIFTVTFDQIASMRPCYIKVLISLQKNYKSQLSASNCNLSENQCLLTLATDCLTARGFTWKDLDLEVKMHPVPPYQHHLLDRTWPLLYGLLSGFSIALLMSMAIFLISIYVSHGNRTKSRSEHQPCCCPLLSVVTSSEVRHPEDTLRPSNGCSG